MLKEFIENHMFMSSILMLGAVSLLLQAMMTLSLKGYVKASANMKTTRKKVMINLKNQFETIYGMDYQVRNIAAYVDKYLLKLRFLGFSFSTWERVPFLTAGLATLLAGVEAFYGYRTGAGVQTQVEILFSYGVLLVCLFVFFHIFGIKSRKEQIQIQLVDYLENYLTNRLIRTKEGSKQLKLLDDEMEAAFMEGSAEPDTLKSAMQEDVKKNSTTMEEDMDMLTRLLRDMDAQRKEPVQDMVAASHEQSEPRAGDGLPEAEDAAKAQADPIASEIELLEEFVQSFLA
ncbi:MAG: hypothetical protein IJ801_06285 [Lachnospiraceae bacterium]|nr:hypothetical protein [Lachnospiraceae bacterium]